MAIKPKIRCVFDLRAEAAKGCLEAAMSRLELTELPESAPGVWADLCRANDILAGAIDADLKEGP